MTSYSSCPEDTYCSFTSILKADFYQSEVAVTGSGTATTIFGRRLGADANNRVLQEESIEEESPFDIIVEVNAANDGPGDLLKTAGGVSVGFTALTSFNALAALMLLA